MKTGEQNLLLVWIIPLIISSVSFTDMSFDEAVHGINEDCPGWILNNQTLIDVVYFGFDGEIHRGQIVADVRLADDIQAVFLLMLLGKFPLESVTPISQLNWDDFQSMEANNTSAFNFRYVPFSERLSNHAYGYAIDINPLQNPFYTGNQVFPENAVYDQSSAGTLCDGHPVVSLFRRLGWRWGGDWSERDYQHFDKRLDEIELNEVDKHIPWSIWRFV